MINQQHQQRQLRLRCQLAKLQLVDLVQQHQAQEVLEVQQHHQRVSGQQAQQVPALVQPQEALVQVQQLERVRLDRQADSAVLQAALEAHLASVARQAGSAEE